MGIVSELNAMDGAALGAALSGPPERVAALLRAAAREGVVEAQLRYGQMLLDGHGVARSPGDALRWFGTAARAGDAMAMNMVGRCFEHGWGIEADRPQAAGWYRAAAARGLDWGMYNLATLLALGQGVPRDLGEAFALFSRAAALGHAKSITMVGSFHENGWAVAPDRAVAADCYARAAHAGDFRGCFNHARFLIADGRIEEGLHWLDRVPGTAPARFLRQVHDWIAAHPDSRVNGFAPGGGSDYANVSH